MTTSTSSTITPTPESSLKRKIFFLVFFTASITQGMYSTYFVSILTTIERVYQIQSKTAGAIMSATEIGQIFGAIVIAYYGGKGNKPQWIAGCMTLMAFAALISTTPHFLFSTSNNPNSRSSALEELQLNISTSPTITTSFRSAASYINRTGDHLPNPSQLCYLSSSEPTVLNSTANQLAGIPNTHIRHKPVGLILAIFFFSLLTIGFGSTAITTLGIPYIDDIVSKEESPLYLSFSIALKVFGPALGFLLGSFCIRFNDNVLALNRINQTLSTTTTTTGTDDFIDPDAIPVGAWWLGLIIISIPLMILAIPMYFLQVFTQQGNNSSIDSTSDFEDITYQAAEDHDIGGSRDLQTQVLTVCDLDVTSNRTCNSDIDSSSREVLQSKTSNGLHFKCNFGRNIILDRPIITRESVFSANFGDNKTLNREHWTTSCLVVNHFAGLESTSLTDGQTPYLKSSVVSPSTPTSSSSSSSNTSFAPPPPSSTTSQSERHLSTMNLTSSLSRLIKNRLLLLRSLSAVLHILPIAGFYTFLPKYLIEQYRIAPSSASAISGLAGILFVGIGAFVGGTIIRLFNINSKFMARWIATSALLYAIGMIILMNLGCPQNQIVHFESSDFTTTDCMLNCKCSTKVYSPVCANGTTYLSPCLAGCKSFSFSDDRIIFDECGCSSSNPQKATLARDLAVSGGSSTSDKLSSETDASTISDHVNLNVATHGHCIHNCDNLKWYIIIFSIFTFIHATCEVGSMMFNLRCVKSGDRTLALGLITFSSSLLGTIPCSIIYGTVIDLTCVHWDTLLSAFQDDASPLSEMRGACRAYKNDTFRYYLHGFTAFVMLFAFIIDCIISLKAKEVDFYDRIDSKKEDASVALKKSTETI